MLYMVIEHYKDTKAVYDRFHKYGRLMPAGVSYVGSWVTADGNKCYQINECASEEALIEWIKEWADIVDFEYYPVISSNEMSEKYKLQ